MKRRELLTLLGGAGVIWPLAARAQQPAIPVVGYFHLGSPEPSAYSLQAFVSGLSEMGFVEGRNVAIEYRWARGDFGRLPEFAAELVRRRVAVIVSPTGGAPALAAKALTSTIPIVFGVGGDPVQLGLVASLNRPGGNITGYSYMNSEVAAKRLGFLHELVPAAGRFALLVTPNSPNLEAATIDARAAAAAIGRQIEIVYAGTSGAIDTAFASLVQKRTDALLISQSTVFTGRRAQILTLTARHALPTIYPQREFVEIGGLMSYGSSVPDMFRQVGIYTGRVLKGEKPAEMPVMRATKFEFVINLQTARTLGITVPPGLRALADEVIE